MHSLTLVVKRRLIGARGTPLTARQNYWWCYQNAVNGGRSRSDPLALSELNIVLTPNALPITPADRMRKCQCRPVGSLLLQLQNYRQGRANAVQVDTSCRHLCFDNTKPRRIQTANTTATMLAGTGGHTCFQCI